MFLSQALERIHQFSPEQFAGLSDVLPPDLIEQCLKKSGTVTLRKRRLPLEMMVWSVVGMALFRHLPMSQIVNQLDIVLPGNRTFVAPSAVVQARQRLGEQSVQTREGLGMDIDFSLPAERVVRCLEHIIEWRGKPKRIRCGNGPEYISGLLDRWTRQHDIELVFTQPGNPQQNAYVERYNGHSAP